MKNKYALLRVFFSCLIFSFVTPLFAHMHGAYSHEDKIEYKNVNWMGLIDNDVPLNMLSIPGTHDSMSLYGGVIAKTQSLALKDQMNSGVRAFDIRCRHIDNFFAIHHGMVFQNAMFGDALREMSAFLLENPTETLLVRVKEEYSPVGNTREFADTFEEYYKQFSHFIWEPASSQLLGDVRGKIVILQDFPSLKQYGISYQSFSIQDEYKFKTHWHLYEKWEKIKSHLNQADVLIGHGYYMNYLSGSGGVFPYFVASGHLASGTSSSRLATGLTTPIWNSKWSDFPRVDCLFGVCTIAFEGTNILTYEYLKKEKPAFVGIIMSDFPGSALIDAIIQLNYKK